MDSIGAMDSIGNCNGFGQFGVGYDCICGMDYVGAGYDSDCLAIYFI